MSSVSNIQASISSVNGDSTYDNRRLQTLLIATKRSAQRMEKQWGHHDCGCLLSLDTHAWLYFPGLQPMKRRNRNQDTMSSRRISHVQNTLIRWRECLCWRGGKTLQQWRGSTGPAGRGEQPEEAWKRLGRAGGRNKLCLPLPAVQRHQRPDTLQGFFLKLPNKLFWLF